MTSMFNRTLAWFAGLCLIAVIAALGCSFGKPECTFNDSQDISYYKDMATEIEFPDADEPTSDCIVGSTASPLTVGEDSPPEYLDMRLEDVMQIALGNSSVLRDLSGFVLRSPGSARTVQNPAIEEMDPRFGTEAALSAFDAVYEQSVFWEKNDRALNNVFFGGGTRLLDQDIAVIQSQLSKRAATGTELIMRKNMDYDANNAPGNSFNSAWNVNVEAEARHPLLQGGGVEFNRIAGPGSTPGVYNGVLIARVNQDISLTDFEAGVQEFVSNVENSYRDLYFSYRDLNARIVARDAALETWRRVNALYVAGRRGGEAEKEAESREQYFRLEEEVQNAWHGRLVEGTRTFNGSGGGTLRGTGGIRVAERRMRMLMGLPISDGRLIRPSDEPMMAKVIFDWDEVLSEALIRRVELRRQKWQIKRRELELIASRNFLLPTLDTIGRYRWRGFGDHLLRSDRDGRDRFDNAFMDLTSGDFQEWQLGLEFEALIGNRRGHAAVRHAELQLSRERAVLGEQERQVVHDLSNAMAEVIRSYEVAQTAFNRREAARQQLSAVQAAYDSDKASLDLLLDAQRGLADNESRYYAALVEYSLAIKNMHFEKGSLLDYNEIYLAEGPWPGKAYRDAEKRDRRRWSPWPLNYIIHTPPPVSQGTYPQQIVPEPGVIGPPTEIETIPPGKTPAVPPQRIEPLPVPGPALGVNAISIKTSATPSPGAAKFGPPQPVASGMPAPNSGVEARPSRPLRVTVHGPQTSPAMGPNAVSLTPSPSQLGNPSSIAPRRTSPSTLQFPAPDVLQQPAAGASIPNR